MLPQMLAIKVGQQSDEQQIIEQAQTASEEVGDQVAGQSLFLLFTMYSLAEIRLLLLHILILPILLFWLD